MKKHPASDAAPLGMERGSDVRTATVTIAWCLSFLRLLRHTPDVINLVRRSQLVDQGPDLQRILR